jgi:hypothetical protein
VHADGNVDVFEYALAKLMQMHLDDAANPTAAGANGKKTVLASSAEIFELLSMLASYGHGSSDKAQAALSAGLEYLSLPEAKLKQTVDNWYQDMDRVLAHLDQLKPIEKQKLVSALLVTVTYDEQLTAEEIELMRAVCAAIHSPLPVLPAG